jgi:hypothetical protein
MFCTSSDNVVEFQMLNLLLKIALGRRGQAEDLEVLKTHLQKCERCRRLFWHCFPDGKVPGMEFMSLPSF